MLPEGFQAKAVASGWRHSLALDTRGCVLTWGWGAYGQLGHDSGRCAPPAAQMAQQRSAF